MLSLFEVVAILIPLSPVSARNAWNIGQPNDTTKNKKERLTDYTTRVLAARVPIRVLS